LLVMQRNISSENFSRRFSKNYLGGSVYGNLNFWGQLKCV
jgi:hypothetical protein